MSFIGGGADGEGQGIREWRKIYIKLYVDLFIHHKALLEGYRRNW